MKPFLSIFCFIISLKLSAQVELVNKSLKDLTQKEIYLHVENAIIITNIDTSKGTFELKWKTEKNNIKKIGKASFNVYHYDINALNKIDTLYLFKNDILIGSFPFILKEIASYYHVQVGYKQDSVYSLADLLQAPFLIAYLPKYNYKIEEEKVYVQRFIVEIDTKEHLPKKHFEVTGHIMTSELKNAIKKLNTGDKLIFSHIILIGSILCPRSLDDKIVITIKN